MINGYLLRFFPKAKYLNEFRCGAIRMMSAYYYATLKFGGKSLYDNRFDLTEGMSYLYNNSTGNAIELTEDAFNIKLGNGVKQICINSEHPNSQIKLSCYYHLEKIKIPDGKFASELLRMGDDLGEYYCLFTDPRDFLMCVDNRLKQLMANKRIKQYQSGAADYLPVEKTNGFSTPIQKPEGLKWQNEYRIIVNTVCESDPFFININNIQNISVCGKKSDLLCGRVVNEDTIQIPNATADLLIEPKCEND